MTRQEFSDQIDVLLDAHKFVDEFGNVDNTLTIKLDEYEKSVLLTEAQEIILKGMFVGGFDRGEQVQMYYLPLIEVKEIPGSEKVANAQTYSENGVMFKLPEDIFWVLNERILDETGDRFVVKPIHYQEYDRIQSKPYNKPHKRQAWKLFKGGAAGEELGYSEIVPRNADDIDKYVVRYVRRPKPIVLEDLGDEVDIRGVSEATDCELHEIMHPDILQKAIELAISRVTTSYLQRPGAPEQTNE